MYRLLLALSFGLVLIALVAGTVGALAYGADAQREGEVEIDGVRQPVTLSWDADGTPHIEASSLPDLALGLGYAHAADHAWAMTLWRQAGQGGLGAWFGPELRPLDRHARALGFDALARQTYRALDSDTRALLDAYAAGVNAALRQQGVAQGDALVLMDVEPAAWAPWDALIVERIVAYLSTPPPAADSAWVQAARHDSSLHPFLGADSTFRATLGIGGTDGARAFTAPAAGGQAFVAHQPTGASALGLLAPTMMRLNGRPLAASTVPGTLSVPMGWDGTRGWTVFFTSSLRLDTLAGPPPPLVHSRIVERDGDEVLVAIPRDTTGLVLSAPLLAGSSAPDSLATPPGWRLRWSGFRPVTDVQAFSALVTGAGRPAFALLRGDGLRVDEGATSVLGSPPVSVTAGEAVFVGSSTESRHAAAVLTQLHANSDTLRSDLSASVLASSDISLWAAQTLQPLLRSLGEREGLHPALDVPYAFLKSWNYRYTPDAIAPSVFSAWLESHQEYTGHAPDPADSLDVLLLPHTLRIARASLRDEYGTDAIDWRWSRLQGGFTYPLVERRGGGAVARRFMAPQEGTGGHPTTLYPGPPPRHTDSVAGSGVGPATWSAWATFWQPRLSIRPPKIPSPDRLDPAIFTLGEDVPQERPRLTLISPS